MNKQRTKQYAQFVLLGLLLLLLWAIQSAPRSLLSIGTVRPVLLAAFVSVTGIVYGEMAGGIFGFVAGLLMEPYTAPSVGFHVLVLTALGMACGLAVKHLFMNNTLSALVTVLASSLVYFILYWLIFKIVLGGNGGMGYLVRFSLPAAGYTAMCGWVLYPLVRLIRRFE